MKKSDIKKSTRLKNLELEMIMLLSASSVPVDLKTLKDQFYGRASMATTRALVKASDYIDHSNEANLAVFQTTIAQNSQKVDVHYTISGTNIQSFRVGGKPGNYPSGIARDVVVFNNAFSVDVTRTGSNNSQWTFTTKKVVTSTGDKKGKPSPVTRTVKSVTIKVV